MRFRPDAVWMERGEQDTPIARAVRARFDGPIALFEGRAPAPAMTVGDGKRVLVVQNVK